jgi:hypothetical protein
MNDATDEFRAARTKPVRDAFERCAGLTLEYKPFILKETKWYATRYYLRVAWVLPDAIEIARKAEQKFDPSRGFKFTTYLRWCLRRLHRPCQREYRRRNGDYPSQAYLDSWRPPRPSHRRLALQRYGDDKGRIQWNDHRPYLLKLDRHQLRPAEKAVLDWMLDPAGRTQSQLAAHIGTSKGNASKLRWQLLIKSRAN